MKTPDTAAIFRAAGTFLQQIDLLGFTPQRGAGGQARHSREDVAEMRDDAVFDLDAIDRATEQPGQRSDAPIRQCRTGRSG